MTDLRPVEAATIYDETGYPIKINGGKAFYLWVEPPRDLSNVKSGHVYKPVMIVPMEQWEALKKALLNK